MVATSAPAACGMLNAERILTALDRHLDHKVELVLCGRAAIALGFRAAPSVVALTLDVDVIVPSAIEEELDADEKFWNARDATNVELQAEGLYITHIFPASMVSYGTAGRTTWCPSSDRALAGCVYFALPPWTSCSQR